MARKLLVVMFAMVLAFSCAKKKEVTTKVPQKKPAPSARKKAEKPVVKPAIPEKKVVHKKKEFKPESIYFDFDKATLKPEAKEVLKRLAQWMKENPNVVIRIEGNCDERGTEEYNLALGQRRADSAKNFLISLGIDPKRLKTISYGEDNPVCFEHNESCWWRNRRCDFKIIKR